MRKNIAKETVDRVEGNLGSNLVNRFKSNGDQELDLGHGDVIKFKIPKDYQAYSDIYQAAQTMYIESGQTDTNYVYVYMLQSVIVNLSPIEIEQIVFECPGLTDIILKFLDQNAGNPLARLEKEQIERSKNESRQTQTGD